MEGLDVSVQPSTPLLPRVNAWSGGTIPRRSRSAGSSTARGGNVEGSSDARRWLHTGGAGARETPNYRESATTTRFNGPNESETVISTRVSCIVRLRFIYLASIATASRTSVFSYGLARSSHQRSLLRTPAMPERGANRIMAAATFPTPSNLPRNRKYQPRVNFVTRRRCSTLFALLCP